MTKTTALVRVACLYFIISICNAANEEITVNDLTTQPTINYLKNVTVWNDKKSTSLREILGDNLNVENANSKTVTEVTFKALCCSYTVSLMDFVLVSKMISDICVISEYPCTAATYGLKHLHSHRKTVLNMFAVISYYSKRLNLNMDKNFTNAIMGINILLNEKKCKIPDRNISYVKSTLELFNNEHCALPELDNTEFTTNLKNKCYNVSGDGLLIECFLNGLNEPILSSVWFPRVLDNDEQTQVQNLFDPYRYMLTEFIDTPVVNGDESTRIKHLAVGLESLPTSVEEVYEHVSSSYLSEDVFKYQMLVVEYTGALMLVLISIMINHDSPTEHILFDNDEDPRFTSFCRAMDTLDSLRPTSLVGMVLKELTNRKLFGTERQYVLESIDMYFERCPYKKDEIELFLHSGSQSIYKKYSAKQISGFLDGLVKSIKLMAPNLLTSVGTGPDPSDILFEAMILLTNANINYMLSARVQHFLEFYCKYPSTLINYFILGDIIVSECGLLANKSTESNGETVNKCFSYLKSYIRAIRPKIKTLFKVVIDPNIVNTFFTPVNRKLFEALHSITLYLDNDSMYEVSNVQNDVKYVETLAAKIEEMKRAHRVIIVTLEQFSNDRCSHPSLGDTIELSYRKENSGTLENIHTIGKQMISISENLKIHELDVDDFSFKSEVDITDTSLNIVVPHEFGSVSAENENKPLLSGIQLSDLEDDNADTIKYVEKLCSDLENMKNNDSKEKITKLNIGESEAKKKILDEHVDSVGNKVKSVDFVEGKDGSFDSSYYKENFFKSTIDNKQNVKPVGDGSVSSFFVELDDHDESDENSVYDDVSRSEYSYCPRNFDSPKSYLFGGVVKSKLTMHCELSKLLNPLQVDWYGKMLRLSDIYDIVINQTNYKYVKEYQFKFERMISFIAYEKIKHVIQSISDSVTKDIDANTWKDITKVLDNLYILQYPGEIWIYKRVSQFLTRKNSFDPVDSMNIISLLETEQSYLGVTFNPNYTPMVESDKETTISPISESKSKEGNLATIDSNSEEVNEETDNWKKLNVTLKVDSDEDNLASKSKIDSEVLSSIKQLQQFLYIITAFDDDYEFMWSHFNEWTSVNDFTIYTVN